MELKMENVCQMQVFFWRSQKCYFRFCLDQSATVMLRNVFCLFFPTITELVLEAFSKHILLGRYEQSFPFLGGQQVTVSERSS